MGNGCRPSVDGKGRDDVDSASLLGGLFPEGYRDPRPILYGGGEEAAAIATRYSTCRRTWLYVL